MGFDLQNRLRPQKPSWQDPPKGMQPTSYFFGSVGSGRSPWGLNFFRRAHQGSSGWNRYKRICEERTPQASPEPTNNEKSSGWNQKILWVDSESTPRNPLGGMDFWKPSLGMHSFGWIQFFAHSFGWNTKTSGRPTECPCQLSASMKEGPMHIKTHGRRGKTTASTISLSTYVIILPFRGEAE